MSVTRGFVQGDRVLVDADRTPWHGEGGTVLRMEGEAVIVRLDESGVEPFQEGELVPDAPAPWPCKTFGT